MKWILKRWLGLLFFLSALLAAFGLVVIHGELHSHVTIEGRSPAALAGVLCLPFTFMLPVYAAVTIVRLLGRAWRGSAKNDAIARG